MADVTKITLPNGTTKDIKDATARVQANWNTNNGVKNLLRINNATDTTVIKIPIVLSSGTFTLSIDNLTSEVIGEGSRCCFMNGENVVSNIEYLQHTSNISAIYTITATSDSLWIYAAGSYNSSNGKSLSITNAMLAPKSLYDADSTYEPYALPNTKITPELIELVDSGAKNLCNNTLATGTISSNITATVSTDKQVTLSGTAPSNADASFTISTNTQFPAGTYIGSGCPSGGATDKYRIDYVVNDSTVYRDTGNGVEFTLNSASNVRSQIVVYRGITAPSAAFAPMVCLKAAWDVSQKYVPYAPTNAELYEMIKALQS